VSYRSIVFYLPDDLEEKYEKATKDVKKSEWFRYAVSAYLDEDSRDSDIVSKIPSEIVKTNRHNINVSEYVYGMLREASSISGETMYAIVSKAVIYRILVEDTGQRTIPIRFTAAELDFITSRGMTVPDAIHLLLEKEMARLWEV